MDQLFISLLLQDEATLIGINVVLIIAGGIAAAFFLDVKITYRRVEYLWFIALSGLALTISQFLWALTPAAADAGLLSILIIVGMGSFALFGAAIYYASAARSRHICGQTSNAWLGFVPLANLWLIFKGGATSAYDPDKVRSKLSRLFPDPILVIGAIVVLALSQGIDKAVEYKGYYDPNDSEVLVSLIANAQTVEERFATEAKLSGAELPVRIDELTILSKIEAQGETLRITYDVEQDIFSFRPDFKLTLATMQCAPEMFGPDIARGGTIEMIYRAPGGRIIETYKITQSDCIP
ncbi:hypothetical protein [Thalassospira australica]|uniref:hypothetical protein n=1 Tax=Thalassospira australica TaxID=1528106 RepID=UPI00384AA9AF